MATFPALVMPFGRIPGRRALDEHQNLTALGRILARLPLDPHVAWR